MAQNVSHSPLVQQSAAVPHPSAAAADHAALERELLDARRKFSSSLESNVLDYLHYSPQALEDCVKTMHTLCSNILEHPDDPKYRKVASVPWQQHGAPWGQQQRTVPFVLLGSACTQQGGLCVFLGSACTQAGIGSTTRHHHLCPSVLPACRSGR